MYGNMYVTFKLKVSIWVPDVKLKPYGAHKVSLGGGWDQASKTSDFRDPRTWHVTFKIKVCITVPDWELVGNLQ